MIGRTSKRDDDMSRFFGKPATGTVVSLERFRSGKSLSPIRQAEAYWRALCEGGEVPFRTQIDPRGLESILNYAFVVERIAPGIARFRLAGHHLNDLAGMEVRGMPLSCFFTPAGRDKLSAVLEHMFDAPSVAELTLKGEAKRGSAPLEARMILLPLRSEQGVVDRALGVLIADGPVGNTPHRFNLSTTSLLPVTGGHKPPMAPVSDPVSDPVPAPASGFTKQQKPMTTPMSHLRLVT